MKICRVIFSTNRPEFLIPTLESHQKYIDFGDHEVYGIFIDDYPKDRNDEVSPWHEAFVNAKNWIDKH